METIPLRLDWLWFLGYDLDGEVPDHSVLSKARARWGVVEGVYGITLRQLREKSKDEGRGVGKKVMSFVAREYGYKGQEIAEYLRRDPAVITRYLKEGKRLESEIEKVHEGLRKSSNVNMQV